MAVLWLAGSSTATRILAAQLGCYRQLIACIILDVCTRVSCLVDARCYREIGTKSFEAVMCMWLDALVH